MTNQTQSPRKPRKTAKPAQPDFYTTKHVANELNMTAKKCRRYMRSIDIRCGSGARHTFTKKQYDDVLSRMRDRLNKS